MADKKLRLTSAVDRISNLPQPIIHQILSLLPGKDVIRTCLLSKPLFSALVSFPAIDLDSSWFRPDQIDRFLDYVNYSTRRLNNTGTGGLEKFKIRADLANTEHSRRIVEAIDFAITKRVKLLDIDFVSRRYSLPRNIRVASSITTLNLAGMRLMNLNEDMMVFWYVLENLCITNCSGMKEFKFSSRTIKSISLKYCVGLTTIKIQSQSLQSLKFTGKTKEFCYIDVSECQFLKVLWLADATMHCTNWVAKNIPKLLHLEELKLVNVDDSKSTAVLSPTLKKLQCEKTCGSLKVRAPNLESLIFNGCDASEVDMETYRHLKNLSMKRSCIPNDFIKIVHNFVGIGSLELESLEAEYNSSCQLTRIEINRQKSSKLLSPIDQMVHINVHIPNFDSYKSYPLVSPRYLLNSKCVVDVKLSLKTRDPVYHHTFVILWNWITRFGNVKLFTLACSSLKVLFCLKELRATVLAPNYDLKHLTVKLLAWASISAEIIDCFLLPSPNLETLCFVSSGLNPKKRSIQFHYGSRIGTKDDGTCCKRLSVKCWRHSLKKVELKNFDGVDEKELTDYFLENTTEVDIIKH